MISEPKRKALEARLASLGVFERDLAEHFIRSGGAGGQNVNKVNTCVYLKHLPSGVEVKCQKTRSQIDNRYFARQILADKIESSLRGKQSAEARERHKIKKQKRKRSKRAKEKILKEKSHRADIKNWRQKPSLD